MLKGKVMKPTLFDIFGAMVLGAILGVMFALGV
jgi:hypothetical protein